MESDKLVEILESNDFNLHFDDETSMVEAETWTGGGVNMIMELEPFTKESFISLVNDFDIDEEIYLHRQGPLYKSHFSIEDSLNDFKEYKNRLDSIVSEMQNL